MYLCFPIPFTSFYWSSLYGPVFHSCLLWWLGILFLLFSPHDIFQVSQMFLPKVVCVNTFMCNQSFSILSSSVSEGYSLLKYHTMYCNREVPRFQRNSLPSSNSLLHYYHFNRLHGIISKQTVIFIVPAVRTSYLSSVLVSPTMWIQNFISMICNLSKSHFA